MASQQDWHFDREAQRRMKRDKLLKVAAECFNSKGFSGTSLKDVAKKLNITDAALYYYVKNKEELVNLCYLRAVDIAEAAFERANTDGDNALEKLQLYIRYQIEEICGDDGPVAILSEIPALKPKHRETILQHSIDLNKKITALIEEGVSNGTMVSSNPVATSDAILGAINWIPKWFRPDSSLDKDEIASTFIETFTVGLQPR
ncbi:MAG: TetR family transcriptional regulator [Pseudomonadales bacterium]